MTKRIINPIRCLLSNGVKYSLSAVFLSMVLILIPVAVDFSSVSQVQAAGTWWEQAQRGGLNQVGGAYGGGTPKDARAVVVDIIKVILGFLGIIAVVLILYAGFKWMTAGGNEDQISDAKKILIAGLIGLAIILSAYIIANFVINQIYGVTTGQIIWP